MNEEHICINNRVCPTSRTEIEDLKNEIRVNRRWDKLIVLLSVVSICVTLITRIMYG